MADPRDDDENPEDWSTRRREPIQADGAGGMVKIIFILVVLAILIAIAVAKLGATDPIVFDPDGSKPRDSRGRPLNP